MGVRDTSVDFYIPDDLIGQCCAAEYFGFLMAKNSLDGIHDCWIRDYLVYEQKEYEDGRDISKEDWKFMTEESGIQEAYHKLVKKIKEVGGIGIELQAYQENAIVLGDYTKDTNIELDKAKESGKTIWSNSEYFNIDSMLNFINILGYDSFASSGVEVVMYDYD
jgi:hypothetical protein